MTSLFGAPSLQQSADMRSREYQELKGRVHNELLGRLNLERLRRCGARTQSRRSRA